MTPKPALTAETGIRITVQQIAQSPGGEFGWMANSSILLYEVMEPQHQLWSYNAQTGEQRQWSADFPWSLPQGIIETLPSEARDFSVSPSGLKILYSIPDTSGTPDLKEPPEDISEAQLWLWEAGSTSKLANLEDCISDYRWSANESIVVIRSLSYRMGCKVHVWMLDLQRRTLQPLFTRADYEDPVIVDDITVDGTSVLYHTIGEVGNLSVRQLRDNVDIPLLTLGEERARGVWLQDEQKVLVEIWSSGQAHVSTGKLWIYDMVTSELRPVIGFPESRLIPWKISPDRQWLAFITGTAGPADDIQALWIADLSAIR